MNLDTNTARRNDLLASLNLGDDSIQGALDETLVAVESLRRLAEEHADMALSR